MELPRPICSTGFTINPLEQVNQEIKRRLKHMEMFRTEASAEKYLYAIFREINKKFQKRRLRNWEYYFQMYLEKKHQETSYTRTQTQLT